MSEIINCLTFVINNWDKLENDNLLIYKNVEQNLNIPIIPYLGLCNFLNYFRKDYYEIRKAIHDWSNLYSMNYDKDLNNAGFWIAGHHEYKNPQKFKNPLRLHAVIWIRNKLLSEKHTYINH